MRCFAASRYWSESLGHDRAWKDYEYLQQKTCEVKIRERKTSEQQKKIAIFIWILNVFVLQNQIRQAYLPEVISDQTMAWLKIGPLGVAFSAMGTASLLNGIDRLQKVEREARKKEKAEKGEYNPNFVANGGDRTFRWLNSPLAVILKSIGLMLIGMVMILMPLFVKG